VHLQPDVGHRDAEGAARVGERAPHEVVVTGREHVGPEPAAGDPGVGGTTVGGAHRQVEVEGQAERVEAGAEVADVAGTWTV